MFGSFSVSKHPFQPLLITFSLNYVGQRPHTIHLETLKVKG